MATRHLTRSFLITSKQTLTSAFSRAYSSLPLSTPSYSLSTASYLFRLRPLVAFADNFRRLSPVLSTVRGFATRHTSSSLNDPSPNWSNRPPKETILLDGCDFEHWLVVLEKPEGDPTRDEIIDSYIKTLAMVIGSEEEARMKIYSVSTKHYFAFGALVSEELSYKIKELPRVRWVLPDSYLDVKNKDYGGEPFINGQAVPYDPKYHEEWVRNNARANERNRRNDRPRNFDRSRNFERRRENHRGPGPMSNQNMQNPGLNMGPPPPPNMGGQPAGNMGYPPNMQQNPGGPPNLGGVHPNNMRNMPPPPPPNMGPMQPPPNVGGPPQNNMGGVPQNNMGGPPQNNMGGVPQNNMGGMPQNNMGGVPSNAPNFQYNNGSGVGPGPNREYQPNYSQNMAGNPYTNQNIPGRDVPPPNYQ